MEVLQQDQHLIEYIYWMVVMEAFKVGLQTGHVKPSRISLKPWACHGGNSEADDHLLGPLSLQFGGEPKQPGGRTPSINGTAG